MQNRPFLSIPIYTFFKHIFHLSVNLSIKQRYVNIEGALGATGALGGLGALEDWEHWKDWSTGRTASTGRLGEPGEPEGCFAVAAICGFINGAAIPRQWLSAIR